MTRGRPATPAGELTEREREVAVLLAQGMPRRAIARRLVISQRTVDTHLRHAYARTVGGGPGARVRLVRWVLDRRP